MLSVNKSTLDLEILSALLSMSNRSTCKFGNSNFAVIPKTPLPDPTSASLSFLSKYLSLSLVDGVVTCFLSKSIIVSDSGRGSSTAGVIIKFRP